MIEHHHHVLTGDKRWPDRFVCVGNCWEPDRLMSWGDVDLDTAKDIEHAPCMCKEEAK